MPYVLYEKQDHIAVITLNRPERMNALTSRTGGEIRDAVQTASQDDAARVIILTGAGRGFCAGADIQRLSRSAAGERGAEDEAYPTQGAITGGLDLPQGYHTRYAYLSTAPKPVIAAINGAAVGVGLVLALHCDVRIAAESARFSTAFAKRGLVAEYALPWLLPRIIGPSKSLDLLYTARLVGAEEAERMGLVDRVVADADLMAEARAYARAIATEVSPRSTRVIKQMVYRALDAGIDETVESVLAEMAEARNSDDFVEGVAAWREKRAPRFSGR